MAFYLDRLETLRHAVAEGFEAYAAGNELAALKERITNLAIGTTDLAGDLEICFKLILSSYLDADSGVNEEESIDRSPQIRLIAFAFDFALQFKETTDNVPKIPFQLIEDVLEHQTIHQAKQIWTIIESWVSRITNPLMFNKGKLVVLKTCNSLLRKLSKSCDTEVIFVYSTSNDQLSTEIFGFFQFCGRILMFLADVFPLSEPSALNLAGKV
jgi:THO complex subunit 1